MNLIFVSAKKHINNALYVESNELLEKLLSNMHGCYYEGTKLGFIGPVSWDEAKSELGGLVCWIFSLWGVRPNFTHRGAKARHWTVQPAYLVACILNCRLQAIGLLHSIYPRSPELYLLQFPEKPKHRCNDRTRTTARNLVQRSRIFFLIKANPISIAHNGNT